MQKNADMHAEAHDHSTGDGVVTFENFVMAYLALKIY